MLRPGKRTLHENWNGGGSTEILIYGGSADPVNLRRNHLRDAVITWSFSDEVGVIQRNGPPPTTLATHLNICANSPTAHRIIECQSPATHRLK